MYAHGSFVTRRTPSENRVFPVPASPRNMNVIPAGASGFLNSDIVVFPSRFDRRPARAPEVTPGAREGFPGHLHSSVLLFDVVVLLGRRCPLADPVGRFLE